MREDWIETPLPDVCDILDNLRKPINATERRKRIEGKTDEELFPYYGATGQVGYIDDFLTDGDFVLIGEDAAPFLDYTKDVAFSIKGKTWVNNHAHILKSLLNNDFLLHYLNQFQYRDYVSGTTRLKLTQGSLRRMPVKVAPLPEQRAIVAKIEELFNSLDSGIADLKKAQAQLKIYRQAVLKKAFEGHKEVPFEEIISSSQNGIAKRKGTEGEEIKVLRLADITNLEIDNSTPRSIILNQKELEKYKLNEGDLIVIRVNGSIDLVGRFIHVNIKNELELWGFCDHFIRFTLNLKICDSKFYYYFFQLSKVRKYIHHNMVSSAGQNTVSQGTVKSITVPLISIEEQHQIVQEIESRLSVCDKVEETIVMSLEKSKALRQSILKKAFEGKLLSKQELAACKAAPDYEPASVLLKRIKAEKATNAKNVTVKKSK